MSHECKSCVVWDGLSSFWVAGLGREYGILLPSVASLSSFLCFYGNHSHTDDSADGDLLHVHAAPRYPVLEATIIPWEFGLCFPSLFLEAHQQYTLWMSLLSDPSISGLEVFTNELMSLNEICLMDAFHISRVLRSRSHYELWVAQVW